MAQQAPEPTTRELRQLFGRLYDKAAGLAESLRPCRCDRSAPAEDSQDLNTMVQELLPVRQRVGGCICGPPCDGTSVDNVSDEFLEEMLSRLQWDFNVLDENLVPCDCDTKPEVSDKTPEPVVEQNPPALLRLPLEIRNMIWWMVLEPPRRENGNPGFVRVVQRLMNADENIPDFALQRMRSSIGMRGEPPHALTFERQDERLITRNTPGRWALLWVSNQVQREAETEFWRRTFHDGLLLSFMPDVDVQGEDYYGILAAWCWFHNYQGLYLQHIRRLQLTLAEPVRRNLYGNDVTNEALRQFIRSGQQPSDLPYPRGSSTGVEFLVPLLDAVDDLPNLQQLSVTIGGLVPDMRWGEPWIEGRADELQPRVSNSRPWVTRLQNLRGFTRLRLRVIFAPRQMRDEWFLDDPPSTLDTNSYVRRTVYFISTLRGSMLPHGQALGDRHIRRRVARRLNASKVAVIECDDSWDEETEEHIQHGEGEQSWDDGELIEDDADSDSDPSEDDGDYDSPDDDDDDDDGDSDSSEESS